MRLTNRLMETNMGLVMRDLVRNLANRPLDYVKAEHEFNGSIFA